MSDVVYALSATGLLPYIISMIVAFGAISLYFKFINKA